MLAIPEIDAPEAQHNEGELSLRYDDVAQDGRLRLEATTFTFGELLWQQSLRRHPTGRRLQADKILPILRRLVITGEDAPVSVHRPITGAGRWALSAVADRERFLLEMRVDIRAPRGDTFGRPVERAGETDAVASVYAEHVLTRPFAPPQQRRVTALPGDLVATGERPWLDDAAIGSGLAEEGVPHERSVRFGLCHTDSNQHVNSLVYPRLFEEMAIEVWDDGHALMRGLHIAYRKPCFAGDQVRLRVQRVTSGERRGAWGTVGVDGEDRPRCTALVWLG